MTREENLDSKGNYYIELPGLGDGNTCDIRIEKNRNSGETW